MGFAGYAICWGCGKKRGVNNFGFCKECWEKNKELGGEEKKNDRNKME